MSDEERIARLTELAREVWPQESVPVDVVSSAAGARVIHDSPGNHHPLSLAFIAHPRALDALEAALLVLSEKGPALRFALDLLRIGAHRMSSRATDAELVAQMRRLSDVDAAQAAPMRAAVYAYCAEMLEQRKVNP